ncbi:hypothetical protein N9L92_00445 [Saprospiraceae bacterium]|nr:hypothetical protein [Saprospiraceae bacterium]
MGEFISEKKYERTITDPNDSKSTITQIVIVDHPTKELITFRKGTVDIVSSEIDI